jgi:ribonuclease R
VTAAGPLGVLKHAGRPLKLDEITTALGPASAAEAPAQLAELVRRGEVVLNRRGQYCLREQLPGLVVGTVQAQRNGDGQLLPDDASAAIHLSAHEMREVMHGDRIAARIEGPRFRGKPQGTIVEVLERRTREVVGRLQVDSGLAYLLANARRPNVRRDRRTGRLRAGLARIEATA